uniref:Uncharacterized protein n=1 Tax=Anguilla anguilla TaxID=7936 RepID=A0A0E9RG12_ANGAN
MQNLSSIFFFFSTL